MSGGQQAMIGQAAAASVATIVLHDDTIYDSKIDRTAEASFSLLPDGTVDTSPTSLSVPDYTYRDGDIAANYEVRATMTVGTFSSGTAGSWLNLATERTWTVTKSATSVGTNTATATFEIRKVGTTTVLDSATITLEAEVTG